LGNSIVLLGDSQAISGSGSHEVWRKSEAGVCVCRWYRKSCVEILSAIHHFIWSMFSSPKLLSGRPVARGGCSDVGK